MSFTPDVPSTEQILASLLEHPTPPLPPQEQIVGSALVSWWETEPSTVYIHAEGGSPDDRHYGRTYVALQLEPHGYRQASFDLDVEHPSSGRYTSVGVRVASWPDIMAKAKRLVQSGQVTLLRNGFNYIIGKVIGDHGQYDTEISRDDPNSRAITSWQCSCPWDQYAWQRTRKWKKFEGRPCAHVMALYWKSLTTPLDEQLTPEQAQAMGTGQALPAPPVAEHPPEIEKDIMQGEKHQDHVGPDTHNFGLPRSFGPNGEILQGDQQSLPGEAFGGPPGPAQAPLAPPPQGPTPSGILPPFPGQQMEMQWGGPGTTPGGQKSPPGAYTVPGAKQPSPANPIQNPSTYSKVTADEVKRLGANFQAPQVVKLKKPVVGLAEGPIKGQNGDGEYREVPAGKPGEVLSQDPSTGWVECIFALDDSGPYEPFHVRCFLEPSDITPAEQTNAFIRRQPAA